ncbi:MAG TPA: PQQ-binding-like beta-propeller repeat protein [Blastocatellia bacterium]|nr:PQQ-binding-like beta-propeller repeat protein [Blastocatellia bacterium]
MKRSPKQICIAIASAGCLTLLAACNRTGTLGRSNSVRNERSEASTPSLQFDPSSDSECEETDSAPVVGSGIVCFVDNDCQLHCLDARTGRKLYSFKPDEPVGFFHVIDGTFALLADGNHASAFDVRTGNEVWKLDLSAPLTDTPLAGKGVVYCANDQGELIAVDQKTGRERWRRSLNNRGQAGDIWLGLALSGDLYGRTLNSVRRIDVTSGDERWRYDSQDDLLDLQVANNTVCVQSDRGLVVLDAQTAAVLWSMESMDEDTASSVKMAGRLLYLGNGDDVRAIDLASGVLKWRYSEEHKTGFFSLMEANSSLVLIQGEQTVYAVDARYGLKARQFDRSTFLSLSGDLLVLDSGAFIVAEDTRTGRQRWRFPTPSQYGSLSPATVASGVVYLTGGGEEVFALSLESGKQIWASSK